MIFLKLKVENGKLKIEVGKTVCKMQIIVSRPFLFKQYGLSLDARLDEIICKNINF